MNYQLEELYCLGEKLGIDRPEIKKCLENAIRNPENIQIYKNHFFRLLKKEGFDLTDLPAFGKLVDEDIYENGYEIGNVIEGKNLGRKFNLPESIFKNQHVLITGITDYGKSHLAKILVRFLKRLGFIVLIIDWADEYKDLSQFFSPDELLVIDPRDFKINYLIPPKNVPPIVWRGELINIFRESMFLRDGSSNELFSVFSSIFRKDNPTIMDQYRAIMSRNYRAGSRQSEYIETLKNRTEKLLNSYLADSLNCVVGHPMEILLNKSIVLRVGLISDDLISNFYVNFILKWIETYLRYNPEEMRDRVIFIEESHRHYYRSIQERSDLREPIIFSMAREIRKRNISLCFIDQIVSFIPKQIFGNINTIISFRLVNSSCIRAVTEACNLNLEQRKALTELPKQMAMIHSGELSQPYLVRIKDFPIREVTEDELRAKMEPILKSLPYIPMPDDSDRIDVLDASSGMEVKEVTQEKVTLRPKRIWNDILKSIVERPLIGLTERYQYLGDISPWYGRKIINEMAKLNLIETCSVSLGGRGNPKTYTLIKPKGAEFLGLKYEEVKLPGKGSAEHIIISNLIAEAMKEAGREVSVEYYCNGKSVDIAEFKEDKSLAYEIELEVNSHIKENIEKDLEAGFDEVIVITKTREMQKAIMDIIYRELDWEKVGKIKFKLAREFF
jgi:DNA helicase HerA-like ATPase